MLIDPAEACCAARPRRSLRHRLWRGGGYFAVFIGTLVIGNFFLSADRSVNRHIIGHDFLPFYFAGTCVRTGHLERLYDLAATYQFEQHVGRIADLDLGPSFGPWWNPPYAAWLFEPLSRLPYHQALLAWWGIGFACLALSIALMSRMLTGGWRSWLLIPLLMTTVVPFWQAFTHGQNTFFSLALLTVTVVFWRRGWPLAAGLVCGLLFYKPQLGAVVALVLCLHQGRRALLGVSLVGATLALVNFFTLPGTMADFLTRMPPNLHWMQECNHYLWSRHVTFKAFWRLLIQGRNTGSTALSVKIPWAICEVILAGALARAIYCSRRQPKSAWQTDRLIAATIASMPLLMPFYFDYDLLLVSIAAVLYAADRQRDIAQSAPANPEDRWIVRGWVLLFITLNLLSAAAAHLRIQTSVPLLAIIAFGLIRRATRPRPMATSAILTPASAASPVALAA